MNILTPNMPFAAKEASSHPPARPEGFCLARGALHEFYAATQADGAGLAALAMMLGGGEARAERLWVRHEALDRETGEPHPAGLQALGIDPARMLLLRARDAASALQAGLEGARCAGLGAVIIDLWGEARAYDLTASRRLALAAKASGVPLFLLRVAVSPVPSAAETRWLARAAVSRPLAAQAPGHPTFRVSLLRARNGQEGTQYHLEWNGDARRLEHSLAGSEPRPRTGQPAPLSGLVVPVSFDRPDTTRDEPPPYRQAG